MIPGPHVFIIDDEESVRMSLSRLLKALGVPNVTFASAEAFLESYSGDASSCLLVDIRMPGMSGLDLLEELARRQITLPAIVMTGHTDARSLQRLEALKPIGFLEKPFALSELKGLLARWRTFPEPPRRSGGPSGKS
jgi:two-component system, LuxR family, response regulator FixJ